MENRKRSEIIRKLSSYFLTLQIGENIPSIRSMSKTFNASIGLLSESISEIETADGVVLDKRGQLGTFIQKMSVGKLWQIAATEPFVIAHTLPSNHRYEGLATALKILLSESGVETYFIFIRGSRTRINALREKRCHVAIISQFAANGLCTHKERTAMTLPPCTFTSAHHLYLTKDLTKNQSGLKVAVDPDSYDQHNLSKIEFEGADVNYQHINFMNIYRYLTTGEVDAAIWTADDMAPHLNASVIEQSLSEHTRKIVNNSDTQAALIYDVNNPLVKEVLQKVINTERAIKIQQEVIDGKRIPAY